MADYKLLSYKSGTANASGIALITTGVPVTGKKWAVNPCVVKGPLLTDRPNASTVVTLNHAPYGLFGGGRGQGGPFVLQPTDVLIIEVDGLNSGDSVEVAVWGLEVGVDEDLPFDFSTLISQSNSGAGGTFVGVFTGTLIGSNFWVPTNQPGTNRAVFGELAAAAGFVELWGIRAEDQNPTNANGASHALEFIWGAANAQDVSFWGVQGHDANGHVNPGGNGFTDQGAVVAIESGIWHDNAPKSNGPTINFELNHTVGGGTNYQLVAFLRFKNNAPADQNQSALVGVTDMPNLFDGGGTADVTTGQGTSNASYTNLATVGPQVTVVVGDSGRLLVGVGCIISGTVIGLMSVTGAGFVSTDVNSFRNAQSGSQADGMKWILFTGITPGTYTFTAQYRSNTSGTTMTFTNRRLICVPL